MTGQRINHPPTQDPWRELEALCGVDLTGAVPCQFPEGECTQAAVWVCVQEHARPPHPCRRTNLCAQHRLKVEMAEAREQQLGSQLICTPHHRDVPTRSRWEQL